MERRVNTEIPFAKTDQWVVDQVYESLEMADGLLRILDIPYTISGGTLLGAMRHKGLIPWDDDGDMDILGDYVPRIRRAAPEYLRTRGFGIARGGFGNFKVFSLRGRQTLTDGRAFYPSVDIFPLKRNTDGRLVHAHDGAAAYWPTHCYLPGELDSLIEYNFGPLRLSGISRVASTRYLNDMYGKGWPTEAYLIGDHVAHMNVQRKSVGLSNYDCSWPSRPKSS
ncbi:LicD family protein [Streptomyces sp. NBS 14/10]|uniref:LicD family protein n=1 Tax=Streptomyces sp. NBS 14/10 TaxID=1945643 RepID=UPI000B7F089F|nr:LicD family protein [Streptomyces sp. NBS 14/10]KAK1184380.1 LicD family protein [Streptomyces sp. NBS 14/10]